MKPSEWHGARAVVLALATGGFGCAAFAFQPLVTDDAGTQGKDANQIEFSIDTERATAAGDSTRTRVLPFTFTRGLTDALDVYAEIANVRIRSDAAATGNSGSGNPVLGVKWRFLDGEAGKTSFALKPELLLPVSGANEQKGLGNGRTSWGLTLIATQELAFGAVHANLVAARNRFRDPATPRTTTTLASVAAVWDVAPQWKLALDLGYESETAGGVRTRLRFAVIGAVCSPTETFDLALGVSHSTNSAEPRVTARGATAGVTWRFP